MCTYFFPSAVSVGAIVGGAVGGIAFLTIIWAILFGVCVFVAYKSKRSGTAADAKASSAALPPPYPI
jgi:Mg/Co/Ni transporter MgtE